MAELRGRTCCFCPFWSSRQRYWPIKTLHVKVGLAFVLTLILFGCLQQVDAAHAPNKSGAKNAYATMLYMGTPRDYEFYVAARVLLRSLAKLKVNADLVVIASSSVPMKWRRNFLKDGVRLVIVEDIPNPYQNQPKFNMRFIFTLNKIYAWTLTEYERVVMLDADNLFLQKTDELFKCGQFCAAFINPCIFHTGLFVLEPSNETFNSMLHDIQNRRHNRDGADQGFLTGYFSDLLDRPMFHPPANGTKLNGNFRLPLGYQMDASYYYLKLKWSVPCGPNSVVTFPSVPLLKPWYWWAYPVLPLGLSWHEQRRQTIGYGSEIPLMAAEAFFYIITIILAMIVRQRVLSMERTPWVKTCFGRGPCSMETESIIQHFLLKVAAVVAIVTSFAIPFVIVPTTAHPFMGWGLWLLGSLSLLIVTINIFQLPFLAVLTPWLGFFGVLLVMAAPFYGNGIIRALAIFGYAFLASPFVWWTFTQVTASIDLTFTREPLMAYANLRKKEMIDEWSHNQHTVPPFQLR